MTGVKRNGVVALYAVRRRIEQNHSFDRFVKILRLKQQAQITQAGSRSF
ncbi:protein of unassigned function [Methylobacterium oryzae CBMB20]|uniref:Protein of unassigned function n=1 Tax=Methylobacterium oryzae CBMB20 TaxID=693986 RepID=A0A089NQL8_9HYPH|nr:protein of unassigned function [Methylobacterium oryzae CBMB20]